MKQTEWVSGLDIFHFAGSCPILGISPFNVGIYTQSSPFLPTTLNGHLLITTRATSLDLGLARPNAMIDLASEERA